MSEKVTNSVLILICILLILSTSACGRWMIRGTVLDADTGKPIEKAAVHICWGRTRGLPGMSYYQQIEAAEDLTDAEGLFTVPKYSTLLKEYDMAVYKRGFVCWSSDDIFPTYEKRKDFKLKDGMVIKLERFKEEYSKEKHVNFTTISSINRKMPGLFDDAIKSERELSYEEAQRNRREKRNPRSPATSSSKPVDASKIPSPPKNINKDTPGISHRLKKSISEQ